jgi:NAD-dependent dihydropyrimidine dehydrogenase PreA subunit
MTFVIGPACIDVKDKSCVDVCPVDCIYEGSRMLVIHPDECVDCGACEPVCPEEAIVYDGTMPSQWEPYLHASAKLFAKVGSPGGASAHNALVDDAPLVALQANHSPDQA